MFSPMLRVIHHSRPVAESVAGRHQNRFPDQIGRVVCCFLFYIVLAVDVMDVVCLSVTLMHSHLARDLHLDETQLLQRLNVFHFCHSFHSNNNKQQPRVKASKVEILSWRSILMPSLQ